MTLNPNNFYHSGTLGSGKLTAALRQNSGKGTTQVPMLRALITAMKDVAVADGTVATLATALGTVETELATAATFNKIVQTF